MRILTLQKNRNLLLAGLLAFAFLLVTQISVQAYEDWGGWSYGTKLIGGYQSLTIGNALIDSSLNIGEMPSVTTGAVTVAGGSQATLNGNVTNMGVASSYYRLFEYWGEDGVHHTTTETTGTVIESFSDTVADISTIAGFNYRAGVRVGAVYTYGATAALSPVYSGTDKILQATPVIIWVALLVAIVYLFTKGYGKFKEGDNAAGQTFWLLAVTAIGVNTLMFSIVLEAIAALLGA